MFMFMRDELIDRICREIDYGQYLLINDLFDRYWWETSLAEQGLLELKKILTSARNHSILGIEEPFRSMVDLGKMLNFLNRTLHDEGDETFQWSVYDFKNWFQSISIRAIFDAIVRCVEDPQEKEKLNVFFEKWKATST